MRYVGALVMAAAAIGAAAPAPGEATLHRVTADYKYTWEIPRAVVAVPAFAAMLRAEALTSAAELAKAAAEGRTEATGLGSFRRYEVEESFRVTANTPRLLALIADTRADIGGAHSNRNTTARLWDRKRRREITVGVMFTDWPEAVRQLTPGFCRVLDAARLKERGEPTPKTELFGACPDLIKQQTVVPVATRGGNHISRLVVVLDPYVAGPYSDGTYTLTLMLAPRTLALLKPEWR